MFLLVFTRRYTTFAERSKTYGISYETMALYGQAQVLAHGFVLRDLGVFSGQEQHDGSYEESGGNRSLECAD